MGNRKSHFEVKTGVRQGCFMSTLFLNIVINWVMRRTPRGIRRTLLSTLEDLDFANDLALVSHTHQHIQEKTSRLSTFAQQVSLKITQKKTGVIMLNVQHPAPVKVNGEDLRTTEEFTYLASIVRHDGGAGNYIKHCLSKARNAFRMMNNVWRSSQYSTKTKPRLQELCAFLSTVRLGMREDDGV